MEIEVLKDDLYKCVTYTMKKLNALTDNFLQYVSIDLRAS